VWVPWSLSLTVAYVHIMCNDKPYTEEEAEGNFSDHLQIQVQKVVSTSASHTHNGGA
jgi:hypothetical protein